MSHDVPRQKGKNGRETVIQAQLIYMFKKCVMTEDLIAIIVNFIFYSLPIILYIIFLTILLCVPIFIIF